MYIVFSADLDAIITSSLLLRVAREEDVEAYLATFYEASKPSDPGSSILLVKVLQRTPVSGVKIIHIDELVGRDPKIISSSTMHLLRELKKQILVPRYIEMLSLIAMLSLSRSSTYDKNIIEVHRALLEEAVDKNLFSMLETLRLFGYPRRDVVEALAKTVDPYVLGVSLNYDGCKKLLEEVGGSLSSNEAKSKLIEILASKLSSYCRSCESLVGPKIILKDATPIDDVYEATYNLYSYIDLQGVDPLIYVCMDSRIIDIAKGVFEYMSKPIKDLIDYVVSGANIKKVIVKGVKVGVVDISTVSRMPPLFTVHKILRSIGVTEDVTVFTNGKEFLLPLPFVAPRWPYDKELAIERGYAVFKALQDLGEVFK
ncbi:MAG: hypothetical protein QXZ41_01925 [Ignisphaera sp.]